MSKVIKFKCANCGVWARKESQSELILCLNCYQKDRLYRQLNTADSELQRLRDELAREQSARKAAEAHEVELESEIASVCSEDCSLAEMFRSMNQHIDKLIDELARRKAAREKAERELETKPARKLYVWKSVSFLAVAHAESVAEARNFLLLEIGESGDGSCPERDEARNAVLNEGPTIWIGPNAEFALIDSGELRESSHYSDGLREALEEIQAVLGTGLCRQNRCEGCAWEAKHAADTARDALSAARGTK